MVEGFVFASERVGNCSWTGLEWLISSSSGMLGQMPCIYVDPALRRLALPFAPPTPRGSDCFETF